MDIPAFNTGFYYLQNLEHMLLEIYFDPETHPRLANRIYILLEAGIADFTPLSIYYYLLNS